MTRLPSLEDAVRDAMHGERVETLRGPDSPEGRELAAVVGESVARHRARRGLDLDGLAARTGIRADLLARLEAGQAVPGVRAMWALATALEVPFGALLARSTPGGEVFRVQRAGHGRVMSAAEGAFRSRALAPSDDPHAPDVYELTLDAGCFEAATAHGPNTFEHLTVVSGQLVVVAGDAEAHLSAGDSLFFRADRPHSYRNPTSERTVTLLVMTYA